MLDKFLTKKNIDLTTTVAPLLAVVIDAVLRHYDATELTIHEVLMWIVIGILGLLQTKDNKPQSK